MSDDDEPPVLSPMMPLLSENMSEQSMGHKLSSIVPLTGKEMGICGLSEIRNGSSPKSMNLYEKHLPNNESLELESETFANQSDEDFEDTKNDEFDGNSTEENDEENEDNEEIEENDEMELNEEIEEVDENEEIERNEDIEQIEDHDGNEENEENEENEGNGDIEEMEEIERNGSINESDEEEEEENDENEENMQLDDLEGAVLMVAEGDQILIQQEILEDENSNQEYVYSALRYSSEEDSDDARK